jgi:hypothetical protein
MASNPAVTVYERKVREVFYNLMFRGIDNHITMGIIAGRTFSSFHMVNTEVAIKGVKGPNDTWIEVNEREPIKLLVEVSFDVEYFMICVRNNSENPLLIRSRMAYGTDEWRCSGKRKAFLNVELSLRPLLSPRRWLCQRGARGDRAAVVQAEVRTASVHHSQRRHDR